MTCAQHMLRVICFTAGVVAQSCLTVLVPSTAFAQHGPGMHGSGAAHGSDAYDTNSEAIFTGTVADVKTGRSALYWLLRIHTLGQGQMETEKKLLLLTTDTGTVEVQLGPTAFLTEKKVEISEGDILEVTGSRVKIGESQVVLAREIRKGDITWTLRESTGQPLWSSVEAKARGFWSTKKVLLTVVVVKIVALATVLRH